MALPPEASLDFRVLSLDGISLEVTHGDQVDPTIIVAAMGVDLEGNTEMLAIRACAIDQSRGLAVCVTSSTRTWGELRGSDRDRRRRRTACCGGCALSRYCASTLPGTYTAEC